jgi:6-pyruvoyltetrahydropterin/6-carboxytetrahydropterin synthase
MFTVSVETRFWASHQLTLSDRAKEPIHSHNWTVTADVSCSRLNNIGLIMDFRRLRAMLGDIVADFDNVPLEKLGYFQRNNSSAENVAVYIYEKLKPMLPKGLKLDRVKVVEQQGCSAVFSGEAGE